MSMKSFVSAWCGSISKETIEREGWELSDADEYLEIATVRRKIKGFVVEIVVAADYDLDDKYQGIDYSVSYRCITVPTFEVQFEFDCFESAYRFATLAVESVIFTLKKEATS